jgi:octaprenyl-diphosphate synthase
VIAGRPPREQEALASFGMNLGIAFQLVDDALDYTANQATLGKTVGDDFREGKVTLPVLAAYHAGDEPERAFWRRAIEDGVQDDGDLERALGLMANRGAIEATLTRAQGFATEARGALAAFPDSPMRRILADVTEYTVSRAR